MIILFQIRWTFIQVRDIGLHLQGGHDHHHDDHDHHHEDHSSVAVAAAVATAAATSTSETRAVGYGRDEPNPPLAVDLSPPVKEAPASPSPSGYPRENPANPLVIPDPLSQQSTEQVERQQEPAGEDNNGSSNNGMGGIPGVPGVDYPIYDNTTIVGFFLDMMK